MLIHLNDRFSRQDQQKFFEESRSPFKITMTSSEVIDLDTEVVSYYGSSNVTNDTFNLSMNSDPGDYGPDRPVSPMGLAGIIATSIILGVMTLTTIVGESFYGLQFPMLISNVDPREFEEVE